MNMRWNVALMCWLALALPTDAQPASLTLEEALRSALELQPQLRQASASVRAAEARQEAARSPMLPQVSASSNYLLGTSNLALGGGFSVGANVSQLLYDFGQAANRAAAAAAQTDVQRRNEGNVHQQVALNVRNVFFGAQAAKVLVGVAQETLANQERHADRIQRMVSVGSRAPIDLALARKDLANARLLLIRAESGYAEARAQLNQAMGREGSLEFDVTGGAFPVIPGERQPIEALMREALEHRPEVAALQEQQRSQEASLRALRGANSPALRATAGTSFGDSRSLASGPALNGGLTLSWPLWNGGNSQAQVAGAEADMSNLVAQADLLRQQIRLEIEQARLAILSGQGAVKAAAESVRFAQEQLRLAEGRYEAGVGSILELSDAQLAVTTARSQEVQEEQRLAQARARLLKALGRP